LVSRREIEQWLEEGIIAAKAGQHEQARFRLLDVVEQDQTNETAWFWLYQLFPNPEDKRVCLENLVIINPHNEWAKQELLNYLELSELQTVEPHTDKQDQSDKVSKQKGTKERRGTVSARPITLKLVTAFWFGISATLLGGGIIASSEWLISSLRMRTIPNYITSVQAIELLIAILFVIAGILGLSVALMLLFRSMIGFYGSVLLALGLLLIGPTVSLIVDPPSYLMMTCTGGISGMIVLLTLASQPGFKSRHDGSSPG
jgi:hypothetical protein